MAELPGGRMDELKVFAEKHAGMSSAIGPKIDVVERRVCDGFMKPPCATTSTLASWGAEQQFALHFSESWSDQEAVGRSVASTQELLSGRFRDLDGCRVRVAGRQELRSGGP